MGTAGSTGRTPDSPSGRSPAERRAGPDERIRDLHAWNAGLTAGVGARHAGSPGAPAGPALAQVRRSAALARRASERAAVASRRAAMMRLRSAATHERAARTYQALVDAGQGDIPAHEEKVALHLRHAAADRAAAEEIARSLRMEPPRDGEG